ncbi:methylated-DNA--[protein]-cysteine S-methyltransferase [Fusicatenibacter saccharivorans]|uniref:methylated-DNA--[protein]-cysteine S-methyltransferase n=1 Tax=Fusicatenibacter saccharivorans TaxID=1150298 RepID=UPI003D00F6FE
MEKETTFYYTFYTRLGDMTVGCTASSIVMLSLNSKIFSKSNTNLPDLAYETEKQILEYLDGKRTNFTLPLAPKGTDFQRKVWDALLTIPYGETRSYEEIAIAVGNPKGCRAVGMANNRNPIMILIPCHRVIGKNGKLVGYGGGLDVKEALLELEGRFFCPEQRPCRQPTGSSHYDTPSYYDPE